MGHGWTSEEEVQRWGPPGPHQVLSDVARLSLCSLLLSEQEERRLTLALTRSLPPGEGI